ncbi:hypothetical protein EBU71_01335, partial [bacterium]|nr:hypothetical protein [Candidatus Elulimicrobium humile]
MRDNFKKQIFDITKVGVMNGFYDDTSNQCTGMKYVNMIPDRHTMNKDMLESKVKKLINQHYQFKGFIEFSNDYDKIKEQIDTVERNINKRAKRFDEQLKEIFSNRVFIIDEVHNLIRLMRGNIVPYITSRKIGKSGKERLPEEPIVPGRWNHLGCKPELRTYTTAEQQQDEKMAKSGKKVSSKKYARGYMLYRLLSDARNTKIIGLSGTPIINFPEELGILSNILAGYIECVEFNVSSKIPEVLHSIKQILEQEPRIDIIRFEPRENHTEFLVSTFNEGYEKDYKMSGRVVGVKYDEDAQENIREIFARVRAEINTQATILTEKFVSYPRLPVDDETFRKEFINPVDLSITNTFVLKKRLTGLISYYNASNEAYMPRVVKD